MFDGLVTVYKNNIDVFAYVIGAASENELILAGVLTTFVDALNIVLRWVLLVQLCSFILFLCINQALPFFAL